MNFIDKFLNGITMYRLVLYALVVSVVYAFILGVFSTFYSIFDLFLSLAVALGVTIGVNYLASRVMGVFANAESSLITALLIFFLLPPSAAPKDLLILALACAIAVLSKYLIAPYKKHIFNPAAFGVFAVFILNLSGATWWAGSRQMLPVILVAAFFVLKKTRRFTMFFVFCLSALLSVFLFNRSLQESVLLLVKEILFSWPIVFFGALMLTEPLTLPGTARKRNVYAVITGLLFGSQFNIGPIYPTPEFVLLLSNIYSFITGFKRRLLLVFEEKKEIAKGIYEFCFSLPRRFAFKPGQYLEFTLPHKADLRGCRRFFTVASSPFEERLLIGMKIEITPSSFKKSMMRLKKGDVVAAGQLAGDFVLTNDVNKKLVFIAGGIGITPFRSMIGDLINRGEARDIVLLYGVNSEEEAAYRSHFEKGTALGLVTNYVFGRRITGELIRERVSDFKDRVFYVSGPEVMVKDVSKILIEMGVSRSNIKKDYFPGLA